MIVTVVVALISSSGVWGVLSMLAQKRGTSTLLVLKLTQYVIVSEANRVLNQGYMTADDYDEIVKDLYEPYKLLGGNGLAEKMIGDISKLPLRSRNYDA